MAVSEEQIKYGANLIYTCLESALAEKKGCLIGRNGSTELTTLFYNDSFRVCDAQMALNLERFSGVFPATAESLSQWIQEYKRSLQSIQKEPIVAGWFQGLGSYEEKLLTNTSSKAPRIPLRSLEPYYVSPEKRWTNLLAGKRVAVVSSFSKTILSQIGKGKQIWGEDFESLLPSSTTWLPIQTGFPPALANGTLEWPSQCLTWQKVLDWLENQVLETHADVCLIGCGGLGMILGSRLKRRGIPCVVLGGAIQVLFGIKGQRWKNHNIIGNFWNDAWMWPSEEETPGGSKKIEGGCYWNPST